MTQTSPSGFIRTEEQVALDVQALRYRSLGWTYQKIADVMGCHVTTARDRYYRALESVPSDEVNQHRKLMGEQIDALLEVAFEQALTGKRSMFAVDRCVTLMDRKARLLGLDTPVKQILEVTRYEGGTDLDREFQRLAELYAANDGDSGQGAVGAEPSEAGTTTD